MQIISIYWKSFFCWIVEFWFLVRAIQTIRISLADLRKSHQEKRLPFHTYLFHLFTMFRRASTRLLMCDVSRDNRSLKWPNVTSMTSSTMSSHFTEDVYPSILWKSSGDYSLWFLFESSSACRRLGMVQGFDARWKNSSWFFHWSVSFSLHPTR